MYRELEQFDEAVDRLSVAMEREGVSRLDVEEEITRICDGLNGSPLIAEFEETPAKLRRLMELLQRGKDIAQTKTKASGGKKKSANVSFMDLVSRVGDIADEDDL